MCTPVSAGATEVYPTDLKNAESQRIPSWRDYVQEQFVLLLKAIGNEGFLQK